MVPNGVTRACPPSLSAGWFQGKCPFLAWCPSSGSAILPTGARGVRRRQGARGRGRHGHGGGDTPMGTTTARRRNVIRAVLRNAQHTGDAVAPWQQVTEVQEHFEDSDDLLVEL